MKQMKLSRKGINKIIGWEVGGRAAYDQYYSRATVPGASSGVTFGFGFDCGYNTAAQIQETWKDYVNPNELVLMMKCAGLIKASAVKAVTPLLRRIVIPYDVAEKVFIKSSVPRFCKEVLEVFPDASELNPDTQSAILSVVFNRGNSLTEPTKKARLEKNRLEMNALVGAISKKDYNEIAKQIESMKRLWDGVPDFEGDVEEKLQGLVDRRIQESQLVRQSTRAYLESEIIKIDIRS